MTPEKFDAAISNFITPQEKPCSTGNSYFRKRGDKRRWCRLIKSELLKNPAQNFYNRLISHGNSWDIGGCEYIYFYIYGVSRFYSGAGGIRYSSMTGRLKLCTNCEPRRKVKAKRLIKKLQRRQLRRFNGNISNGAEYKRLHMKNAH